MALMALVALVALGGSLLALQGCGSSSTSIAKTALVPIGSGVDGPAGLRATVYAKGPTTTAAFAFDQQGRLWLTAAGLESHPHDGVYLIAKPGTRALNVVSGLDDPLGLTWHDGTLYVASLGRVDAFAGFDGQLHRTQEDPRRPSRRRREQPARDGARRSPGDGRDRDV